MYTQFSNINETNRYKTEVVKMFPTSLCNKVFITVETHPAGELTKIFLPGAKNIFGKKPDRMQSHISVVNPVYIVKYYVHLKLVSIVNRL